jgi:hypothetical protein
MNLIHVSLVIKASRVGDLLKCSRKRVGRCLQFIGAEESIYLVLIPVNQARSCCSLIEEPSKIVPSEIVREIVHVPTASRYPKSRS